MRRIAHGDAQDRPRRCAGSPTAMLLARAGYRVLLVDRATFPSDTVSTHFVHAPGVAALKRWGLLDRLAASGCPARHKYTYDFGPFAISGSPQPVDGVSVGYGPRRTVLDKLLLDAAGDAGAEIREGFAVEELVFDESHVVGLRGHSRQGSTVTESARVVIGADGRSSVVARGVGPERYNEKPALAVFYYSYWSDLPTDGIEIFIRPQRGCAVVATHDDLTLVAVGWPSAEFETNRRNVEAAYMRSFEMMPAFAERLGSATREERLVGTPVPNFFRKPYGPGWALVGDAGYTKDPVTALGITDAFLCAEWCASALTEWLSDARAFDEAMADYQQVRDEHSRELYGLTCEFATLEPPPPDMQRLLAATQGNQPAMDGFVSMMAGTLPVHEFLEPGHVERIIAAAAEPVGS